MIFQDPYASLDPRMRVIDIIGMAPVRHGIIKAADKRAYVTGLMEKVGLSGAYADRFPHQFSGGQRQRIGIARALAVKPRLIICDEAVAALDVSIQAQVLNLFMDLRADMGLTYLFISHNLGVVEHISHRVVIMYLGRVVEIAPTEALFTNPNHPYTRLLMEQLPVLDPGERDSQPIAGELPSPLAPPPVVVAVPAPPPPVVMAVPSIGQAQAAQPPAPIEPPRIDQPRTPVEEATARPAEATPAVPPPIPVRVNTPISVKSNSWVELRAPNGDVLTQTYVRAGESYVVPAGIAYRITEAR